MFVVTVTFELAEQHVEAFRAAIRTQANSSLQREEACRQFDVCFDPSSPQSCFLYEKYDSSEAFDAHRATEHFKEFSATVGPFVIDKQVRTWIEQS